MAGNENEEPKEPKGSKLPPKTLVIRVRAQIRNGGPAVVEAIVSKDCVAITWIHNHTVVEEMSGDETAIKYTSEEPGTVWAEARFEYGDWRMSNKVRLEGV